MQNYDVSSPRTSPYGSRSHRMKHYILIAFAIIAAATVLALFEPELQARRFYLSTAFLPVGACVIMALAQTRLYRRRFRTGASYHVPRMVMYGLVILWLLGGSYWLSGSTLSAERMATVGWLVLLMIIACAAIIADHARSYIRGKRKEMEEGPGQLSGASSS